MEDEREALFTAVDASVSVFKPGKVGRTSLSPCRLVQAWTAEVAGKDFRGHTFTAERRRGGSFEELP